MLDDAKGGFVCMQKMRRTNACAVWGRPSNDNSSFGQSQPQAIRDSIVWSSSVLAKKLASVIS
jgi:hypothetical protein